MNNLFVTDNPRTHEVYKFGFTTTTRVPEFLMKTPPVASTNTTGIRGVSKVTHGWRADITRNGVQTNLGTYDSFQDAVEARLVAQWGLS